MGKLATLIPCAVPTGYGGEAHVPAFNPDYAATYATRPVYGPPSLMLSAAARSPIHQARQFPTTHPPTNNQYLLTVRSAEAPAIPMRGAKHVKPGTRVVFKGPNYFMGVKAPSIDEVQTFMAARGPLG